MVDQDRLAGVFKELVEIDSVSRKEGAIAKALQEIFESLDGDVVFDGAGPRVEGEAGNLIARFKGTRPDVEPLLINAHMDTVQPGEGIKVLFSDGVFTSDGSTILGADDKSAVAVIIETLRILQEAGIPYGPLEVVITVCEEVGLLGAKNLDYSLLTARFGYSIDATDTEGIVTQAPSANHLSFTIHGRDAHAGAAPEKGINAIQLAGKAISELNIGRIDEETTANIGLIEGGKATNIVPSQVSVKGEVRSHDVGKLEAETKKIVETFERCVSDHRASFPSDDGLPRLDMDVREDFAVIKIPDDHPVVSLAKEAASNLGREMTIKMSGGGSDANIFFGQGVVTGILGTGMKDMHTVRESVRLDDMVKSVALLVEIVRIHSSGR